MADAQVNPTNTDENRNLLAREVVEHMDLDAMYEELVRRLEEDYEYNYQLFLEDWETHIRGNW